METKYNIEEVLKLFPRLKNREDEFIKDWILDEIIQTNYYTKSLIDNFKWFKEYFLNHDIKANLELPYVVISHLAWFYFSSEEEIQEKIGEEVHNFILKYFNINEMRYLLLAWFFESYAFDSKEKYEYFVNRLPHKTKNILKKYLKY